MTSTMSPALGEADKLLFETRASRAPSPQSDESLSMHQNGDEGSRLEAVTAPPRSIDQPNQAIAIQALNSASRAVAPPIYQTDLVPPNISTQLVSDSPTPKSSPNPIALLVDDNVIYLRIMQMYCKKRNLPYHCAADGPEAVEIFVKHQFMPASDEGGPIPLILHRPSNARMQWARGNATNTASGEAE
jgi:hypothetical protein